MRSVGGWDKVLALRRGRERCAYDKRVLGGSNFIEEIWKEAQRVGTMMRNTGATDVTASLENLFSSVAGQYGLTVTELSCGSRRREVVEASGVVSYVTVQIEGLEPTRLGRLLHVSRQSVLRGVPIDQQLMVKNRWELNSFWS